MDGLEAPVALFNAIVVKALRFPVALGNMFRGIQKMFHANRKLVRFLAQVFEVTFREKRHDPNIAILFFFYILSMSFATLFKMSRPVNIVIAIVTLVIGYFLLGELPYASNGIKTPELILQALGFAAAIAFANIQNDILDLESDKMNRPSRPLVCGKASVKAAKITSIILAILTIASGTAGGLLAYTAIPVIFFIALALLLIAYNIKLKHLPLLKNMTVAFLCTTPLILCLVHPTGPIESDDESLEFMTKFAFLFPAMLFAFLLTTAREIYKDLEDEIGDLKAGIMTFPLIAGPETARRLAGAILIFTWISLPMPVMQGTYPTLFVILTAATLTPSFIYIIVQARKNNYRKSQAVTKLAMFLGLISLVVSAAI